MFFEAAELIMRAGWQALSTINFPGTSISIAAILIGSFLAVLSLKLVSLMVGHVNFGGAVRRIGKERAVRESRKGG